MFDNVFFYKSLHQESGSEKKKTWRASPKDVQQEVTLINQMVSWTLGMQWKMLR